MPGRRPPQQPRYRVSVVTRDEVGAYKPYLWEQSVFSKGPLFREWLLTKVRYFLHTGGGVSTHVFRANSAHNLSSKCIKCCYHFCVYFFLYQVVNAERASYAAPNFARMQERTRSQMLEDLVANLQNHAETGQIPKPYRYVKC